MAYAEEDYLQISGIQHFAFCRRQWAMIYIEGQWAENARTVGGTIFHERAHDAGLSEKRGDLLTVRGLRVFSATLGISGECDVVEFRRGADGVRLRDYDGLWLPMPVEYKSGTADAAGEADKLQLCLEAMCLEEMLCCDIPQGALYYGEIRRRSEVTFTPELRQEVRALLAEMHSLYTQGKTPKVKPTKACGACSLKELCLPKLMRSKSVSSYLRHAMEESP